LKDVENCNLITIEGIALPDGTLHPVQQAFIDAGAIQCGFCTPGMVLTAYALLNKNPHPTRQQVRQAIRGNLCRCTGYQQIIDAVMLAAERLDLKQP
jgi:carbon-monoxide dehydrogenase small subunit